TYHACVALRDLELGKEIHGYVRDEIGFSMIIGNALLDMYCKCGCLDVAREIFDRLLDKSPDKDIVLRTAIINGYIQFNHVDESTVAAEGERTSRSAGQISMRASSSTCKSCTIPTRLPSRQRIGL
nr:hypothetical protein [Tanacetum cinerariifolium]